MFIIEWFFPRTFDRKLKYQLWHLYTQNNIFRIAGSWGFLLEVHFIVTIFNDILTYWSYMSIMIQTIPSLNSERTCGESYNKDNDFS